MSSKLLIINYFYNNLILFILKFHSNLKIKVSNSIIRNLPKVRTLHTVHTITYTFECNIVLNAFH